MSWADRMRGSPMDMVPGGHGGYDGAAVEAGAVPDGPYGAGATGEAQAMEQRVGLAPRRWGRPLRVLLALAGAQACDRARTCLELAPGFAVVGVAPNGHRALALAAETEPDVAVVEADLPAGGLAVVPALRRRSPASVVVALASPAFDGKERPSFEVGTAQPGGMGADVYLGPGTPLVVLTDVLADLAVRLDQESRRPLRGQWPAHVPPPVARWAESVHGPELRLVRGVDHGLGGVRNPGRAEMSRMGTRSSRPSRAEPRPAPRRGVVLHRPIRALLLRLSRPRRPRRRRCPGIGRGRIVRRQRRGGCRRAFVAPSSDSTGGSCRPRRHPGRDGPGAPSVASGSRRRGRAGRGGLRPTGRITQWHEPRHRRGGR